MSCMELYGTPQAEPSEKPKDLSYYEGNPECIFVGLGLIASALRGVKIPNPKVLFFSSEAKPPKKKVSERTALATPRNSEETPQRSEEAPRY